MMPPRPITFEDYLQAKHAESYMGTDDDMPDSYEHWISQMDVQEVCELAEKYGQSLQQMPV